MSLTEKKIYKVVIVSLILFILLPSNLYGQEKKDSGIKNILIIDSYSNENTWISKVIYKFTNEFERKNGVKINLNVEHLNSRKYNDKEYCNDFIRLLNSKYKNFNADILIVLGINGLEIIREEVFNEQSIFYQTPVLFSGVPIGTSISEEEEKYITGILYDTNIIKIVNLIKENHEETSKIKLILAASDFKKTPDYEANYKSIKNIYARRIQFECISEMYIEDIIEDLRDGQDSNYAIIVGNTYLSRETQKIVQAEDVIEQIKLVSDAPIYTYDENYVEKGAIGGVVGRSEREGMELAEMAKSILIGGEFPDIRIGKDEYIINYKEVYKKNININKIPKHSVIVNKPKFELLLPKSIKYIIIGTTLSLVALITYILQYIYKQGQAVRNNKKLYEQIKLQEQIKSDFITGISHDLKAPINVIRSSVQLLDSIDEEIEQEYLSKRLKVITQNSNKLLRLVNNLVDTVKLEEGNCYQLKLENVNLVEIIEDICFGALDYMNQRELEFIFDTEEEEIVTAIDREKIERVILNLLSNAIKFTPQLGKISVHLERLENQAKIQIQDTGIGIANDKLEGIFLKFYQIDNKLVKPSEGSGIGLYIVKRLIDLHEGEITVASKEGEGTSFTILLPIKEVIEKPNEKIRDKHESHQIIRLELSDL